MKRIIEWLPLIWTLRIGLLILVAGGAYLYVLLIARFFRWRTIRDMVLAEPPRVESVGGEFAGAKAEVKLAQQAASNLEKRVAELEATVERVTTMITARSFGDE
jgi:septal ring factor EnvC (AmiA/AmiB activator)